jgi:hypothetical protein
LLVKNYIYIVSEVKVIASPVGLDLEVPMRFVTLCRPFLLVTFLLSAPLLRGQPRVTVLPPQVAGHDLYFLQPEETYTFRAIPEGAGAREVEWELAEGGGRIRVSPPGPRADHFQRRAVPSSWAAAMAHSCPEQRMPFPGTPVSGKGCRP